MITFTRLLEAMTSRDRLARWPQPGYRSRQFSSYDRDSVAPDRPGWFANRDYNEFLRIERTAGRSERVLVDADGPGAVVRFWNALGGKLWHDAGVLRFYFDHNSTPAIEAPLTEIVGGQFLAGPPFSYALPDAPLYGEENYLARNLFLPLPYAQHCKITWECRTPDAGLIKPADPKQHSRDLFYYNIECVAFAPGTPVETFSLDGLRKAAAAVSEAGRLLLDPEALPPTSRQRVRSEATIGPGDRAVLLSKTGEAGAIRRFRLSLEGEHDFAQALRSTVVEIVFDGEVCAWCPAGDFFGTGPGLHPHSTWLTRIHETNWMQCRWTMPYAEAVEVRLLNLGRQTVAARAELEIGAWTWDDQSMHFHATWHEKARFNGPPADCNYVTIKGRGVYVGDSLAVFCARPPQWNSTWWGEGDEKIYVDGESFPSHFGTGTEDYYGYAWCRPNFFERPWHAQPCGAGNKRGGLSVNNRYRLLDAIPFETSLAFDMEIWLPFADQGQWVNFAPTTFFYAFPGVRVTAPVPDADTVRRAIRLSSEDPAGG